MFSSALLCAGLAASSCQEESPSAPAPGSLTFKVVEEDRGVPTRSLLTAPDIETKKTCVTLAAYSDGILVTAQDYGSSLTAMPMDLAAGTYDIYALVNMGAQASSIPASESDMASFCYDIPSYASIASMGMPMAGSDTFETCTAASGTQTISVKRLLARVEADLACGWPGATITGASVHNLNARLRPFTPAGSAAASASEVLSDVEIHGSAAGSSPALSAVFYVPENRQGIVPGVPDSSDKRPDGDLSAISSKEDLLTYLEVSVTGSGVYPGAVTYRSYLGSNAATDFDILRNTRYLWAITYHEDGLQDNNWKVDTDGLGDTRTFTWNSGPVYVDPDQSITFSDHFSTNITTGIGVVLSGADSSFVVQSSTSTAFTVKPSAGPGRSVTATAAPLHNPVSSLISSTVFTVRRWIAEWTRYNSSVYSDEGKKVYPVNYNGTQDSSPIYVEAGVSYRMSPTGSPVRGKGEQEGNANGSKEWTYSIPSGISASLVSNGGNGDRIIYSVPRSVHPGDYPVTTTVKSDGFQDTAFIRVVDNRYIVAIPVDSYDSSSGWGFTKYPSVYGISSTTFNSSGSYYFAFGDLTVTNCFEDGRYLPQPALYGSSITGSNVVSTANSNLGFQFLDGLGDYVDASSFRLSRSSNINLQSAFSLSFNLTSPPPKGVPHRVRIFFLEKPDIYLDLTLRFALNNS